MFESVLAEQNPHWVGTIYDQGIGRECLKHMLRLLKAQQVISLRGFIGPVKAQGYFLFLERF